MVVYINSIKFNRSLVDGPGVRTVVFFQGCDLHCKGCQNPSTWDIKNGTEMTTDELVMILQKEVINKKVTFSGGEPLMQVEALIDVVKKLKDFDIAVYTGHEYEDVPQELLDNITYIKTGSFKEELKSTVKPYVGYTNQEFRRVK
jgi:anaerobic ribonucleoside-triphosphate reductase activating protein